MCRFLIIWEIWPHWQSECGLCFRGPSVVHQWWIGSSPVWLPWLDFPAGNVGVSCNTLFDMSFDSPPLVGFATTTDGDTLWPSCNWIECDSQMNPCCCVTYCRMGIHGLRLVIWSESMKTENIWCEDHPSSRLCQWPWYRCCASVGKGYLTYASHNWSTSLVFQNLMWWARCNQLGYGKSCIGSNSWKELPANFDEPG